MFHKLAGKSLQNTALFGQKQHIIDLHQLLDIDIKHIGHSHYLELNFISNITDNYLAWPSG
jgi:hypothetical protein